MRYGDPKVIAYISSTERPCTRTYSTAGPSRSGVLALTTPCAAVPAIGATTPSSAPPAPSAAEPTISSSSWLEQQELAEVLEDHLTGVEAVEVTKIHSK
jgi:hypothetical protein